MEAVKTDEQAEWLEYWSRRNCIGSSDIKSIVGTCSQRGPHDVHIAKTDENYVDKVTPNMVVGLVMEPALGELTRLKQKQHTVPTGTTTARNGLMMLMRATAISAFGTAG